MKVRKKTKNISWNKEDGQISLTETKRLPRRLTIKEKLDLYKIRPDLDMIGLTRMLDASLKQNQKSALSCESFRMAGKQRQRRLKKYKKAKGKWIKGGSSKMGNHGEIGAALGSVISSFLNKRRKGFGGMNRLLDMQLSTMHIQN